MAIPAWLQAHLENIGQANPDGVSRAARATRCRQCRAHILTALDGDVAAMPTRVTNQEIDEMGEFLAISLGIPTYTLRRAGHATKGAVWHIDGRNQSEIKGPRRYAVMAQHQCGVHLPPAVRPVLPDAAPTRAPADPMTPPF
ncbi:MAG: hypothetical protein JWO11_3585 [Nocardioides sp.]|nr:hypothetical protein [Nocardioides sp.]